MSIRDDYIEDLRLAMTKPAFCEADLAPVYAKYRLLFMFERLNESQLPRPPAYAGPRPWNAIV